MQEQEIIEDHDPGKDTHYSMMCITCAMYLQRQYHAISLLIKTEQEVFTMASSNVTMRMDQDLKEQLQKLLSELGLDMTTYFTMSAKQAVREQAIPFRVSMDTPNTETIKAIRDTEKGIGLSREFSSVKDLMEDLDADDQIPDCI